MNNNMNMNAMGEEQWRNPAFRQNMVSKIEEAVNQCGAPTTKTALEMENQVFSRAKTKDEYLAFVARLIIHIKEVGQKKMAGLQQQQQQQQGGQNQIQGNQMNTQGMQMGMMGQQQQPGMGGIQQQQQQQSGMNQQMQNNQMIQGQIGGQPGQQQQMMNQMFIQQQQQQLNQQQQQGQMGQVSAPQNQMQQQSSHQNAQGMHMQGMNTQLQLGGNVSVQIQQPQSGMQNAQMQNMQQLQQQQHIQHQQQSQMQNALQQQNQMNQPGQPNVSMQQQHQLQHLQMQNAQQQAQFQQQQQQNQLQNSQINSSMSGMMLPQQQQQQQQILLGRGIQMGGMGNRMMGPGSGLNSHLANMSQQQNQLRKPMHRGMVPKNENFPGGGPRGVPGQFIPPGSSPQGPPQPVSSVQIPSSVPGPPNYASAIGASNAQANTLRTFPNQMSVPSPGASINTPLMAVATPSPRNPEEQACFEKIKELRKYTDLLQRMIAKIGNEDFEKSSKMKKLLEILTSPKVGVSMEILLKCEIALKKMEKQQHDIPLPAGQEKTSPFQQILESYISTVKNTNAGHTLARTFGPSVEAFSGYSLSSTDMTNNSKDFEYFDAEEEELHQEENKLPHFSHGIPAVLYRELKVLDRRFKVSVKKPQRNSGKPIELTCNLLEARLPSVPPLKILIGPRYPHTSPQIQQLDDGTYDGTPFLKAVIQSLKSRLYNLYDVHTITEILNCWEMSVRQATDPDYQKKAKIITPTTNTAIRIPGLS